MVVDRGWGGTQQSSETAAQWKQTTHWGTEKLDSLMTEFTVDWRWGNLQMQMQVNNELDEGFGEC